MWGRDSRKARLNHELRFPPASAGSQALRHTARRALSYEEAHSLEWASLYYPIGWRMTVFNFSGAVRRGSLR